MSIGKAMKKLRMERSMAQGELAKTASLTQATISKLENGTLGRVGEEALQRIAQALGVTVEALVELGQQLDEEPVEIEPDVVQMTMMISQLSGAGKSRMFMAILSELLSEGGQTPKLPIHAATWADIKEAVIKEKRGKPSRG